MQDLKKVIIDPKKLKAAKETAETFYKTIGQVYCPCLKEKVIFNSLGMEHLKFKGRNKARSHADQYIRFRLLKLAPEVVRKSHTLQEFCERRGFEKIKVGSHWETKMVDVAYYTFVAIMSDVRMKVVIKQIGDGHKFFWSLIPFWRQDKNGLEFKKIFHSGDPEED